MSQYSYVSKTELQVKVRLYGYWDIPLFASGSVHFLDSDWLLAQ